MYLQDWQDMFCAQSKSKLMEKYLVIIIIKTICIADAGQFSTFILVVDINIGMTAI